MKNEKEVTLRAFSTESEMWAAQKLYIESFPREERRDTDEWARFTFAEPAFSNREILLCDEFAGFIGWWQLSGIAYIEHFAVRPELRGKRVGGRALDLVCRQQGTQPIVLEVEPPETGDMEARRVVFYERHGFRICRRRYMQPPYRKGEEGVELRLMFRGISDPDALFDSAMHEIHEKVYGISE